MPVILHPRDYSRWLDRDSVRPPVDLLRPFESEAMLASPCNPLVGNVRNNGLEIEVYFQTGGYPKRHSFNLFSELAKP